MADRKQGPDLTNTKKRYAVDVIRLRAGERHRSTIPAMSALELRFWARQLNPFDVVDIVLMEMGEVLGIWTKAEADHGVEAFVVALTGEATEVLRTAGWHIRPLHTCTYQQAIDLLTLLHNAPR